VSTRASTDACIDHWARGRGIEPVVLKELKRDIAVICSTPQLIMRDDSKILMEVAKGKSLIEKFGPVTGANHWLNKVLMPYWMQKCVQWFVAEAYSAGIKEGRHGKKD
jgi:hypothetical protein